MDPEPEDTLAESDVEDTERIFRWRLDNLINSGYKYRLSFEFAMRPSLGIHQTARFREQGCSPHAAARILL